MSPKKRVRYGMIGGSLEAFIGNVHRMAANLDGECELVCGVFSSDHKKSIETGLQLGIPKNRLYSSIEEMIESETKLDPEDRIHFISIVTPNHLHAPAAKAAINHGFHVLCEKPLCFDLDEAVDLVKLRNQGNRLFGVTYTYTGYPMVKEARQLLQQGEIGTVRKVIVEYPQGWLTNKIEDQGQKQASWRLDPDKAGASSTVGDIGTHIENLIEYILGESITEVSAFLNSVVPGRKLEDDASAFIKIGSKITGTILATQVASGEENELKFRAYGDQGGIEWLQSNPGKLIVKYQDKPTKILTAGSEWLSDHAKAHCRLPTGHPEGYIEAMANIYRNFALAVRQFEKNAPQDPNYDFPDINSGLRGMKFIKAMIESSNKNSAWTKVQ